jgi:hypothetical protein
MSSGKVRTNSIFTRGGPMDTMHTGLPLAPVLSSRANLQQRESEADCLAVWDPQLSSTLGGGDPPVSQGLH